VRNQKGFTLLEVMVAFTLIVFVVFATVTSQMQGLAASQRDRNIIIATSLARNLINQTEVKIEGKPFDTMIDKKETGEFEEQKGWKWTVEYKKVDFGPLTDMLQKMQAKEAEKSNESGDQATQTQMLMRVFKDYMERSVLSMRITIEWPEGSGTTQQTFSQLLVNYDQELNLGV
jgi:Tfp pilus assembly protein PilV